MNIGKWIIPDKLHPLPFHRPAPDSIEYERLVHVITEWMDEPDANKGPIYLWMPEWLNVWVWEAWAWQRRLRGLPVYE